MLGVFSLLAVVTCLFSAGSVISNGQRRVCMNCLLSHASCRHCGGTIARIAFVPVTWPRCPPIISHACGRCRSTVCTTHVLHPHSLGQCLTPHQLRQQQQHQAYLTKLQLPSGHMVPVTCSLSLRLLCRCLRCVSVTQFVLFALALLPPPSALFPPTFCPVSPHLLPGLYTSVFPPGRPVVLVQE